VIPENDRIETVMTVREIAEALESGDYSAEMLMQHLVRHHNRLKRELSELRDLPSQLLDVDLICRQRDEAERRVRELEGELRQAKVDAEEWRNMAHSRKLQANSASRELDQLKATLEDPAEVELAMIRGDIAIPHRVEFDGIRDTPPAGDNPTPTDAEIDAHLDECVARSERDWKELP